MRGSVLTMAIVSLVALSGCFGEDPGSESNDWRNTPDNTGNTYVPPAEPEFEIRDVQAPNTPAGEYGEVTFDLRNTGDASGNTDVKLYINGGLAASDNIQVAAGNEQRGISLSYFVDWTGNRPAYLEYDGGKESFNLHGIKPTATVGEILDVHNDYGCSADNGDDYSGYFFFDITITNTGDATIRNAKLSTLVAKNSYTTNTGFTEFVRMYTGPTIERGWTYLQIEDLKPGESRTFDNLATFKDKHFNDTCGDDNTYQAYVELYGDYLTTAKSPTKEWDM